MDDQRGSSSIDVQIYQQNNGNCVKRRMQVCKFSQSYFQKKGRLYTISTSVKSSSLMEELSVRDVGEEDADFILNWYSYEKADG